jgi:hypothetical protein
MSYLGPIAVLPALVQRGLCSGCKEEPRVFLTPAPAASWRAMAAHASQFVWYRRLFVLFSRCTWLNVLSPLGSKAGGVGALKDKLDTRAALRQARAQRGWTMLRWGVLAWFTLCLALAKGHGLALNGTARALGLSDAMALGRVLGLCTLGAHAFEAVLKMRVLKAAAAWEGGSVVGQVLLTLLYGFPHWVPLEVSLAKSRSR